jgi:dipeptide/tripeptide permease
MDGTLGSVTIQPEQMFIISPFMILFLVPIMDKLIFPLLNKKGLFLTPLKKIGIGGFLAAMSFVIAGIVELNVEVL